MRRQLPVVVVLCLVGTVPAGVQAQSLPVAAKADDVGVSTARLDRIASTMNQYVKERRVAGVVTIVVRQAHTSARTTIINVPAKREITIRDLLTHTAGISYGGGILEDQYKAANIYDFYFSDKTEPIGPIVERLAALPFQSQPGERHVYGFSTDILSAVIERASGMSLDEFFRTRIFAPLKMPDTYFFLPPEKAPRLATLYGVNAKGTVERAPDAGRTGQGEYVNGPRMCLELMTSNHSGTLFEEGRLGFGLGFEITEHLGRSGRYGSVGDFGWGGAYYTSYWADPQEQLVAVFMSQTLPATGLDLQQKFRELVYASIVASPAAKRTPSPASSSRR